MNKKTRSAKPTKKNSAKKGSSSLMPIIVIVIVLFLAVGGYMVLSNKMSLSNPLSNQMPKATEKDFDFVSDPLVKKHFVAQANQTEFRTSSLSSGKGGKSVMEVQIQGTTYKLRTVEFDESGKEVAQMMMLGDTTYVKDYKDNTWWKEVAKPEPTISETQDEEEVMPTPESFKDELMEKKDVQYKQLGTEACGDMTCYKYEETDPENTEATRTFWFDNSKFLLRKEEMGFGEFKTTNEYSYDSIRLSAPSPTKDVPEGKNIYEYLYSGTQPSADVNQEIKKMQQQYTESQPANQEQQPSYEDQTDPAESESSDSGE